MSDPKEQGDATRRYFEQMTQEQHRLIYAQFFHTYLSNLENGYPEQVEASRNQMASLLSFGKISENDRLVIEARTCRLRAETRHMLSQIDKTYRERPNTKLH